MTISLSKQSKTIVEEAVASGNYASPEAVIDAGLELLAAQSRENSWLRDKVHRSLAEGGSHTFDEVIADVEADLAAWERARAPAGQS